MRIGLVCPYDIFKGGGVQEVILAQRSALEKRGHFVRIITPLPRSKGSQTLEGVEFVGTSADMKSPFHTTAQISVNFNPESIDELLGKYKFDILHFHEPWVPVAARQILTRSNSCNIATFHAKLPETVMSKTIEKVITPYTSSITKFIDGYTAVSEAAAEYVRTLTDENVTIIPNGIDIVKYKAKYVCEEREDRILYIGRLEKRKGLIYLLRAFTELVEQNKSYKLDIAGDGADMKKLVNFVKLNDIPNVVFHGQVSHDDKIKLMKKAKVFTSPALYGESFGIVLIEAMSMGLPIVAGRNPGYSSVLEGFGDICLIDPTDVSAYAKRLRLFLENDEDVTSKISKWGKNEVKKYDFEKIIDRYEKLYEQVYANRQSEEIA